jgi:hypothetical protein
MKTMAWCDYQRTCFGGKEEDVEMTNPKRHVCVRSAERLKYMLGSLVVVWYWQIDRF